MLPLLPLLLLALLLVVLLLRFVLVLLLVCADVFVGEVEEDVAVDRRRRRPKHRCRCSSQDVPELMSNVISESQSIHW